VKLKKIVFYGLGILLALFVVSTYIQKPFTETALVALTVTAKERIATHSGRYAYYGYSFRTAEFKAKFTIDDCINFVCDREAIKAIESGDKLAIMIENDEQTHFEDSETDIPVFSLAVNSNEKFSPKSYLLGRTKQNLRRLAFFSILVLAVILLKTEKLKPAINWAIFIAYFISIILLIKTKIL
jgi:hypothetical protein